MIDFDTLDDLYPAADKIIENENLKEFDESEIIRKPKNQSFYYMTEKIELYEKAGTMLVEQDANYNPALELFWINLEKKLITALLIFTDDSEEAPADIKKLLSLPVDELFKTLQQNADAAPFVAELAQAMPNIKNSVIKSAGAILDRSAAKFIKEENFYSDKNKRSFSYRNERELKLLKIFEADSNIQTYEMFMLPILDRKTNQAIEEAVGYVLYKQEISYILVSEYLTANPNYANQIKPMIFQEKGHGEVIILNNKKIDSNVLGL